MFHPYVTQVALLDGQIKLKVEFEASAAEQFFQLTGHATQNGGAFANFYAVQAAQALPDGTVVAYVKASPLQEFKNDEDVTVVLRTARVSATVLGKPQPRQGPLQKQAELAGEGAAWSEIKAASMVAGGGGPIEIRPRNESATFRTERSEGPSASLPTATDILREDAPEAVRRSEEIGLHLTEEADIKKAMVAAETAGAASQASSAYLAGVSGRVAELEAEVARLQTSLATDARQGVSARQQPMSASYVAGAVVAIEDHLADMDRFAATGNLMAAQESLVAAAMRSCRTLRRLCDEDDFHDMLTTMGSYANDPGTTILSAASGSIGNIAFKDFKVQLLQLSGLPEVLARIHVDAAVEAYQIDTASAEARLRNPMSFLGDLRQLRDWSCLTADQLSQDLRRQQARQRRKKILTFGLSGTLIVAANSIGTVLLGPGGAAASGAIGSAAVGVAVQLLS